MIRGLSFNGTSMNAPSTRHGKVLDQLKASKARDGIIPKGLPPQWTRFKVYEFLLNILYMWRREELQL